MNRRSFIKSSGVASLGIGLNINKTFSNSVKKTNKPVVVATWDVKTVSYTHLTLPTIDRV